MRVLLTNAILLSRTGTELAVRDLAAGLRRRGHSVAVYCPRPGDLAKEIRSTGVPVVDDLATLEPPDIIHGHHHVETMTALLHFPDAPALFVCHDATSWHDEPPLFPRIYAWIGVDEATRARLAAHPGLPRERIEVVPNAVDLGRFRPRAPLPPRPRRAVVFSNYASEGTHLPAVRSACARAGIELDVIGAAAGRESRAPESELPAYDLVFAKARCALEAAAVGCAVILCDAAGAGPMVTAAAVEDLRRLNFGSQALTGHPEAGRLLREIARYDPADAASASARVRSLASLDIAAGCWEQLYRRALDEHRATPPDRAAEGRAAAAVLRRWDPWDGHRAVRLLDDVTSTRTWRLRRRLVAVTPLARLWKKFSRG